MFSIWIRGVHPSYSPSTSTIGSVVGIDVGSGSGVVTGNGTMDASISNNKYQELAPQMLNMLLLNTLLAPFVDILTVYVYNKCCCFMFCCVCCTGDVDHVGVDVSHGDEEYKYKFNVADEYTQLLFRQYLINQCILFVPSAPLVGILGCFLEWWTDKYKLIKLCKVPQRHNNLFTRITIVFLLINTLAVLFSYPNGYFF
jgi:hypothetical protein